MGTILLFLLVLSLLVFVHEAGHFFVAKRSGMKVEEFGFGFPPRLWGIKKKGTLYSINWIPLGGFVRIKGESGSHKQDQDSFAAKSFLDRFLVLVAGVVMNLVLAVVLFSIGFTIGLPTVIDEHLSSSAQVRDTRVQIISVLADSPAQEAGLERSDVLVAIDGQTFENALLARAYLKQAQQTVTLTVERDEQKLDLDMTPRVLEDAGITGIGAGIVTTGVVSYPPLPAIAHGVSETAAFTTEVVGAFAGMLKNIIVHQRVGVDLSGPVGIAVMTGEVASLGFVYLLQFTALLSINLAVLNILPFPALDGGRILFLLIEAVRRKPVDQRIEAIVHNTGFILLMALVVLVTYRDIVHFGQQLIGTV